MIRPIDKNKASGGNIADAVCDQCQHHQPFVCDYERISGKRWEPNEGQITTKATKAGWSFIRGVMRCPNCTEKYRAQHQAKKERPVENVQPIRQPTREEKRQIVEMLTIAYDTAAGRYRGTDTDKTIAEALGGGVMPGWVAEIREELFGPDGGNAELDTLAAEIEKWAADFARKAEAVDKRQADLNTALREFRDHRDQAAVFSKRIDALKAAIGPKAARA